MIEANVFTDFQEAASRTLFPNFSKNFYFTTKSKSRESFFQDKFGES